MFGCWEIPGKQKKKRERGIQSLDFQIVYWYIFPSPEMKHKMKLINLLTSTINYFATEPKSSGDRRRQWIDRNEKLHYLHLKSEGQEIRDREIMRLALRIRAFFGQKWGTKSRMWKRLMQTPIWGKQREKSNVDFSFFFLNTQQRAFSADYRWHIFLINFETLLGWWGLNFVTSMDQLLILPTLTKTQFSLLKSSFSTLCQIFTGPWAGLG